MLVQVDVVEADLRVEVGDLTEVFLRIRDGPSEVVRDAGPRVEKDVAVNAGDVHCDNDSCRAQNVVHGQFGDGVVYREVVVQVCNGKGLFLVVEKHLVLFKEFHPPEFVYVRIEWLACPFQVLAQCGDSLHVSFVDIVWAARVDKDALAVVGDDEVVVGADLEFDSGNNLALGHGFFEGFYHFDSLEAGYTLKISSKK